jgi:predicted RNase H-like HicB family nuclease
MNTYEAIATREDGWWMIHVPAIDGLTQSRRLADAPLMARELIAITTDTPLDDIDVDVAVEAVGRVRVREALDILAVERAEAARLEADASARARDLARNLTGQGIPLRDIGTILGVSHQRAHQLVNA